MGALLNIEGSMSYHYFDIIQILVFLGLLYCSYKLHLKKKYRFLGIIWIVVTISFFNMPVVTENKQSQVFFTQERKPLPEKVSVEKESFDESYKKDLESLRKENKQTEENL